MSSEAMTIGGRIRATRKMRHMSVKALAGRVAISESLLEKIERGDRNPSGAVVTKLAAALGVGPEHLNGQPYYNGTEADDGAQAIIPDLYRMMLTYDSPEDLGAAPRPLEVLAMEVEHVSAMRQNGQYVAMGPLLPPLLLELTHAALGATGHEQERAFWQLARGYRAANSLAHKLGHHHLSSTAIERVQWAAARSGDPLMEITAEYLLVGALLRAGAYGPGRRRIEQLRYRLNTTIPEGEWTDRERAVLGALTLKLAMVEARENGFEQAADKLLQARAIAAASSGDTTHYEMSFGPTNIGIHEVAALIDDGDTEQALARLREWGAAQGRDEWELPEGLVAERASHHHIDVAAAKLAEGDRAGSFASLEAARRIAPNHTRFHPTVRHTAETLVRLDRHAHDSLAGYARWAGV